MSGSGFDEQDGRPQRRHRLSHLLGMRVRFPGGRTGDQVTDVRLEPGDRVVGHMAELVVDGLVVGRRRPGSLLGYDRYPSMGPWMIRVLVRALHRHTGYVQWADVERVDWDNGIVELRIDRLRQDETWNS
jgi:hypothetical protein